MIADALLNVSLPNVGDIASGKRVDEMSARNFDASCKGIMTWSEGKARCVLGKAGVIAATDKREGDNKSPLGAWAMRRVFFRPDRETEPTTALPVSPICQHDGWCDDPTAGSLYNQPVTLPCAFSCEHLWRDDHVYDLIVELGYNDDPPIPGRGSAIFMHLARPDFSGTEGCVALARQDLLSILEIAQPGDVVRISA